MKVYIVESQFSAADGYSSISFVEKVFTQKKDADDFAKSFNDTHMIKDKDVYNIMPKSLFEKCLKIPHDEKADFLRTHGYTYEQYNAQADRFILHMQEWGQCIVTAYEVE